MADGQTADRERLDALAVGGAMIGRDGVLADTDNAPAIVLGRGRAHGLFDPSSEPFGMAHAVRPAGNAVRRCPRPAKHHGRQRPAEQDVPGSSIATARRVIALIYQNTTWRLFGYPAITRI